MLFVGCLILGIGIGLLFDEAGAGTLIGLGVGFILEGLLGRMKAWYKHKV